MTAHRFEVAETDAEAPRPARPRLAASGDTHTVDRRGDGRGKPDGVVGSVGSVGSVDGTGPTASGIAAGLHLTASAQPAVVFASLAAQCVPDGCDSCVIDITETGAEYRIAYPQSARLAATSPPDATDTASDRTLRLRFAYPVDTDDGAENCRDTDCCPKFDGVASFTWHVRTPTSSDRLLVGLLIDHAVRTIAWQRGEKHTRTARAKADNLELALRTSREIGAAIGILMGLHKLTQEQAFDVLRVASQRSHRKLRDLALDVIDTGWLDPALVEHATL